MVLSSLESGNIAILDAVGSGLTFWITFFFTQIPDSVGRKAHLLYSRILEQHGEEAYQRYTGPLNGKQYHFKKPGLGPAPHEFSSTGTELANVAVRAQITTKGQT